MIILGVFQSHILLLLLTESVLNIYTVKLIVGL